MSVVYDWTLWLEGTAPWLCSDCGKLIELPAVIWQGIRQELLHAACAAHKGAALLKDSRECELAADPRLHWRRRALGTVRHRLQVEETAVA